jgi:16S rRNA processing protein RimM
VKAHGVKGAVQVEALTDFPSQRFSPGSRVLAGGALLTVTALDRKGDHLLLRFEGIDTREAAARLGGAYLTVPLDQARSLPAGRYYHYQLVGLSVVDQRSDRVLGTVVEVLSYDANDVLRVTAGVKEVLVPMVRSIVREIEPSQGRIVVDMPDEGLG